MNVPSVLCDFCCENEATHFNMDWDALLCDECAEAQDNYNYWEDYDEEYE